MFSCDAFCPSGLHRSNIVMWVELDMRTTEGCLGMLEFVYFIYLFLFIL